MNKNKEVVIMRLKGMVKKMKKDEIPECTISRFESIIQSSNDDKEAELKFVKLMDELLEEEQRLSIWERNGSCDGGGRSGKAFALENADKSLAEKIEVLKNANRIKLNEDGTFTAERACHCTSIRPEKFTISPTFYGCAAAAALYNYEIALGVKLKLTSYKASPRSTDSEKPCLFTFEIKA